MHVNEAIVDVRDSRIRYIKRCFKRGHREHSSCAGRSPQVQIFSLGRFGLCVTKQAISKASMRYCQPTWENENIITIQSTGENHILIDEELLGVYGVLGIKREDKEEMHRMVATMLFSMPRLVCSSRSIEIWNWAVDRLWCLFKL